MLTFLYLLQQLVCNLRKQAVHVITILGGSLEQDNIIYTTEQCRGVTRAVSPVGNTSRACWRTPPPRPRESRGRRGLSCYPPAPATPAHSRAQYHGPIRVEGYRQQPMRAHLGAGVLLDLPQPVRAAVEGGLVGHVVHEDQGVGGPVVGLQYGNVHI